MVATCKNIRINFIAYDHLKRKTINIKRVTTIRRESAGYQEVGGQEYLHNKYLL